MRYLWIILCFAMVSSFPIMSCAHDDQAESAAIEGEETAKVGESVDLEDTPVNQVHLQYQISPKGDLNDQIYKEFETELNEAEGGGPFYPPLGFHQADLNDDGVNEYIVRFMDEFMTCNQIGCHHAVISVDDNGIKRLGYFPYSEINISQEKTNGVKNLLVFNNTMNDFAPNVYVWDDEVQAYSKYESKDEN